MLLDFIQHPLFLDDPTWDEATRVLNWLHHHHPKVAVNLVLKQWLQGYQPPPASVVLAWQRGILEEHPEHTLEGLWETLLTAHDWSVDGEAVQKILMWLPADTVVDWLEGSGEQAAIRFARHLPTPY